jgi:Phage terminase, small subunit
MGRGRKPIPPHVKALRGNPGKRPIPTDFPVIENLIPFPRPAVLEFPEFLSHERERHIFKLIIEDYLQRRVARAPDFHAFGRWSHYMHRWICCKEQLEGKATWFQYETAAGKQIRRHPLFRDMLDIERMLESLEDRLGLNPAARQNILRGLTAMPAALGGDIFPGQDADGEAGVINEASSPATADATVSPLGFLHADKDKLN